MKRARGNIALALRLVYCNTVLLYGGTVPWVRSTYCIKKVSFLFGAAGGWRKMRGLGVFLLPEMGRMGGRRRVVGGSGLNRVVLCTNPDKSSSQIESAPHPFGPFCFHVAVTLKIRSFCDLPPRPSVLVGTGSGRYLPAYQGPLVVQRVWD